MHLDVARLSLYIIIYWSTVILIKALGMESIIIITSTLCYNNNYYYYRDKTADFLHTVLTVYIYKSMPITGRLN